MYINVIILVVGLLFKIAPINKNKVIGYKTPFAQKNKDTWNTANNLMANLLILIGIVSAAFTLILKSFFVGIDILRINLLIVLILIILSIVIIEIYLRIKFKSDGSYRNKD